MSAELTRLDDDDLVSLPVDAGAPPPDRQPVALLPVPLLPFSLQRLPDDLEGLVGGAPGAAAASQAAGEAAEAAAKRLVADDVRGGDEQLLHPGHGEEGRKMPKICHKSG